MPCEASEQAASVSSIASAAANPVLAIGPCTAAQTLTVTALVACLSLAGSARGADGAALYQENCASCHGAEGATDTPVAKAMNVPTRKGTSKDAAAIAKYVRENDKHKAASDKLSDEQLAAIGEAVQGL